MAYDITKIYMMAIARNPAPDLTAIELESYKKMRKQMDELEQNNDVKVWDIPFEP